MTVAQLPDKQIADAVSGPSANGNGRTAPEAASAEAGKPLTTRALGVVAKAGGDLVVYYALRAVWGLLHRMSPERTRNVLESIGGFIGRVDRHHRRVVGDNLLVAFPHWNERQREDVIDLSFRNWGRLAAEAIHAKTMIEAAAQERWDEAAAIAASTAASGRGLLVLTAHTGNFEILARTWGARIGPLAVFHRNLGNPYADAFLRKQRQMVRMTMVGRGASVREALRLLANGTSIAVALDQNQRPGRGVFVQMFGKPACTSTMLARLSIATGTAVLPVFAVWDGKDTVPLVGEPIAPPSQPLKGDARTQAVLELTQLYTTETESAVRSYPEQWNWAHRRWKTRPQSEAQSS